MIAGLILAAALVAAIAWGTRRLIDRGGGASDGHAVRRFFQYLVLYGLLVVAASGLIGLLARLFADRSELVRFDATHLARSLAFAVLGLPLYVGMAAWSRRRLVDDPAEGRSFGWALYLTLASLTALVAAMVSLHGVLAWIVGFEPRDGGDPAGLLVWAALWVIHLWAEKRFSATPRTGLHHLLGSLIGLATAATGLIGLLAGAIDSLMGEAEQVIVGGDDGLARGAVTFVVGAPVWIFYWLKTAIEEAKIPLWLGYVLLAGVGGPLAAAIAAASTVVYRALVWWAGDPVSADPERHFADLPTSVATVVVAGSIWWYHRSVLEDTEGERSEVRRVYEYLMAGVGLVAAAAGVATVLVALIEGVTGGGGVVVGQSSVNTLLAALTLLLVGSPVWWLFWRRIQHANPAEERLSPTRRIYLFLLFGVGGVAAVISLLTVGFIVFEDTFEGSLGAETLRSIRFALAILATTGAVAAYHWAVYRLDRQHGPIGHRGPRYVLLIGAADEDIAAAVARHTG
ncbi:MAG TPA: DUF5671 domain-containing protein [Acidimicrobiia bacterium]|nr:DUF5671 domain-containing protein [Acidimicrobiia bacterium]